MTSQPGIIVGICDDSSIRSSDFEDHKVKFECIPKRQDVTPKYMRRISPTLTNFCWCYDEDFISNNSTDEAK